MLTPFRRLYPCTETTVNPKRMGRLKSRMHCRWLRASPVAFSPSTRLTLAPSSVSRLAIMRPISPEPRITTFFPGSRFWIFIIYWAVPAVYMPEGRLPGVRSCPKVLSRQRMARITVSAVRRAGPSVLLRYLTLKAPYSPENSKTDALVFTVTGVFFN